MEFQFYEYFGECFLWIGEENVMCSVFRISLKHKVQLIKTFGVGRIFRKYNIQILNFYLDVFFRGWKTWKIAYVVRSLWNYKKSISTRYTSHLRTFQGVIIFKDHRIFIIMGKKHHRTVLWILMLNIFYTQEL